MNTATRIPACVVSFLLAACSSAAACAAQDYPSRPIRFIDGFVTGGNTDVLARTIGQKLYESWGQPVVVDNRPGAASNLAAELVVRAPATGYTLFMGWTTTMAISRTLYPKLGYDATRDLAPVGPVASSLLVLLAHPSVPASSVHELVALAKSRPGHFNYASAGAGTGTHLAAELFRLRAGVNLVHVAYKGGAPAATAIAAGETQIGFASLAASQPLLKAGRVKGLAVTSGQRSSALPGMPTLAESGFPGYDVTSWYGIFAPTGTPPAVLTRLNGEVGQILKMPDVTERLRNVGLEAKGGTSNELAAILSREIALYARVIKDADIKAD